jgi:hypothetical protein
MPADDSFGIESRRHDDPSTSAIVISSPMKSHALFQAIGRGVRLKEAIDPNLFVTERSRVHETYIREQENTKRLNLILSAILLLAACAVVVFAPAGREGIAHWMGAALLVTSAGAAGYKRIWGRSKRISFGADQSEDNGQG